MTVPKERGHLCAALGRFSEPHVSMSCQRSSVRYSSRTNRLDELLVLEPAKRTKLVPACFLTLLHHHVEIVGRRPQAEVEGPVVRLAEREAVSHVVHTLQAPGLDVDDVGDSCCPASSGHSGSDSRQLVAEFLEPFLCSLFQHY